MAKVKVGDVVHLIAQPEIIYTVVEDMSATFKMSFNGLYRIVTIDVKHDNKPIKLTAHEDALFVVK